MRKILISEHQVDSLVFGLVNEQQLLTEGKFGDSIKALANSYFPSFLVKINDEQLKKIELAFVQNQVTSSEARKWIIAMVLDNHLDMLLEKVNEYALAVKRFIGNKALIELNGNDSNLYTGNNENDIRLNYSSINGLIGAAEPRAVTLLKQAVSQENAGKIIYEDAEVVAIEITRSTPIQRQAQEIISGWCTKNEPQCKSYSGSGHLCDILYKGGGQNPFKNSATEERISALYSMSGSIQMYVKKEVSDSFGNTTRNNYGSDVEIRNKQNTEITMGKLFNRYNPKLLSALSRGIIDFIGKHEMLFWYDYTANSDVKKQFPDTFINNIDKANKQALQNKISQELGVNGILREVNLMKYEFVTEDNRIYVLSINNAISQAKIKNEFNPKDIFRKLIKRKMKDPIVSYNGVELMDLNKPETFVKYVDLKQLAASNPMFAPLATATVEPGMFGNIMFNHYKSKFPSSSNVEIFNSYFEPYLNVDKLYTDYVSRGGTTVEERKVSIKIPIYKHELTSLLLRSLEEIETMSSMIFVDVDLLPEALAGSTQTSAKSTIDTSGSMQ